ncbi:MAG: arylesterase [Desulfobacterales bacterium]|nr:arylesterase [Desulfobacterales bacterium]
MKKTVTAIGIGIAIIILCGYHLFFSPPNIRNSNPSGENIICFGDSLTYGTGASSGMDYPAQLSKMISKPIINAGVPGDTTESALERLEKDVLSKDPRIVLITLGGNDLKNNVPKEIAFDKLTAIIKLIQSQGTLVIVGGIDIPLRGRRFGDSYKKLCDETEAVLIPNIFEGIMGKQGLMSDYIHPNDKGYTIMAEKFYKKIKPFL